MTLESTSWGGRVRHALSGRPKVAIVTGASRPEADNFSPSRLSKLTFMHAPRPL